VSGGAAERLRRVPLFAELDDDELERVAAVASEFEVPAGHVLIERTAWLGDVLHHEGA
jgi:hypothetical protein